LLLITNEYKFAIHKYIFSSPVYMVNNKEHCGF